MLRVWLEKYRHCKIGSNGNGTSVVDGVVDGCKKKRCGILQPNWKAYKLGELRHQNKKKIIKLNKNEHRKIQEKNVEEIYIGVYFLFNSVARTKSCSIISL